MRRFLWAAAIIALVTPQIALAQDHNRGRNDKQQPSGQQQHQKKQQRSTSNRSRQNVTRTTRVSNTAGPAGRTRTTRVTETTAARPNGRTRTTRVTNTMVARPAGRTRTTVTRTRTANALPTYRPGHRPSSFHRIRVSSFHYPRGYSYRRWRTGSILPRLFLSSLYYWTDWAALGLGPPSPGYVWVRYGPDLLLVNRYNGRIADVIYGAFY